MDSLVQCRPVWLPAYALEWAGEGYADVLLGEGPSRCRGARAQAQVRLTNTPGQVTVYAAQAPWATPPRR